jgi:two-component system sensor histidine kinase HydH
LDQVDRHPVALRTWLAARVEHFREQAARREIALVSECADGAGNFDEKKMGRALDNLLINALQHTPAGGKVMARAERSAGHCLIAVENSGTPISAEKRAAIFEPFTSGRDGGTGLGLSIALEIVKAHGGTLRCVDANQGARFEMEVPCPES